jgi:hypothetical protein
VKSFLSCVRLVPVAFCLGFALPAAAQTDEIQVYDATIAPTSAFNLTLHNNFTPAGSNTPAFPGGIAPDKSLNGVAEWAYGVLPWFEAGVYFPLYSLARDNSVLYNGFKLRALFVTPDAPNAISSMGSTSNSASTRRIGISAATPPRSAPLSVATLAVSTSF